MDFFKNNFNSCRMECMRGDKSERISQISSQYNYSISDELASTTIEVKTIKKLVECMNVSTLFY